MNPLEILLAELEGNRLEVALIPQKRRTNEGGMIRVAVSRNAAWYRSFCSRHLSARKRRNLAPDTAIRRANIVSVLGRLIAKGQSRSRYAAELTAIAAREGRKMGVAA